MEAQWRFGRGQLQYIQIGGIKMKLLFNKTEYYGHWFQDDETPDGFTEKVPPNTGYIFDEEANDWVLKPEPEPEGETDNENTNEGAE
jgi:hypothetical protein